MHIFRWDLDKTYLKTRFGTAAELLRTAMQGAHEKENIPGTAALMRGLRRAPDGSENRIFVVSGSPREMRAVLTEKLRLDGVEIDGLVLKPNLQNLLTFRFRALRDQLGYKLPVLLEARLTAEPGARETCFGDDAEMDAVIYRLYGDICEGVVDSKEIERIGASARLYPDQTRRIVSAAERLPVQTVVERICIHLDAGSPTARFDALGPKVAPTFNTFQTSLVLYGDERISRQTVLAVHDEMVERYGYTPERLSASLADAVRRGLFPRAAAMLLADELGLRVGPEVPARVREATPIDYVSTLAELDRWHHERKDQRRRTGLSGLFD